VVIDPEARPNDLRSEPDQQVDRVDGRAEVQGPGQARSIAATS